MKIFLLSYLSNIFTPTIWYLLLQIAMKRSVLKSGRLLTHLPLCRIYVSVNWFSMGSRNGSSSVRHQAITWTNADLLSIKPLWTIFIEISIEIQTFSLTKRHLKMSCAIFPLSCPGRDGLIRHMPPISLCFFIYHSWICVIYLPISSRVSLLGQSFGCPSSGAGKVIPKDMVRSISNKPNQTKTQQVQTMYMIHCMHCTQVPTASKMYEYVWS